RPIEQLDARIEMECRALDIPAPQPPPPSWEAVWYFGFTQLPFRWEPQAHDNSEPRPLRRMFKPDDVWRTTMRRLLDQVKLASRKRPDPMLPPPDHQQPEASPSVAKGKKQKRKKTGRCAPVLISLFEADWTKMKCTQTELSRETGFSVAAISRAFRHPKWKPQF